MLEIITSEAIPLRHGFFTRKGGASSGIFAGLNCGPGSSDQSDIVMINRARVAGAMGVQAGALISLNQIHSADVVTLTGVPVARLGGRLGAEGLPGGALTGGPATGGRLAADGMVTRVPGLALGILTADCQPVLFADPDARVIGAAHAGWRGARAGVLEATVAAMLDLGATRAGIRAVIGPCISARAYEVGPEFLAGFTAEDAGNLRFFAQGPGDRMLFDLPAYGLHRLRLAGVGVAEWTGHCTFAEPERFYSFRRTTHAGEADYGRLISAITL